jgi:hypothetical protein
MNRRREGEETGMWLTTILGSDDRGRPWDQLTEEERSEVRQQTGIDDSFLAVCKWEKRGRR